MFVRADVILQETDDVLTVPTQAVINAENGNIVYTIKNNMSFITRVQTGFSNEDYTQITQGLSEGDSVRVRIIHIDPDRRRMGLSMKDVAAQDNWAEYQEQEADDSEPEADNQ